MFACADILGGYGLLGVVDEKRGAAMQNEKGPGFLASYGVWPVCCAVLFVVLVLRGDGLAAFLIAASGVAAMPKLTGTFRRYGMSETKQFKSCVAAAATSCVIVLAFPSSGKPAEAEPKKDEVAAKAVLPSETAVPNAASASMPSAASQVQPVYGCQAIDGDTIKCNGETIRLLGIDAPEMPGHCRIGRVCVEGDPFASQNNLRLALSQLMTLERIGSDRFGRTIAAVYAGGQSLSCHQLATGQAVYVGEWDDGGRVAVECGLVNSGR